MQPQIPAKFYEQYGKEALERRLAIEQAQAQAQEIERLKKKLEELDAAEGEHNTDKDDGRM